MLSLVLGAIFFAGIHLGVAGTALRDRAIAALGESAYRAAFSIASLAGIVWLMMAYKYAPYVATWGIPEWWKPIAMTLMLPAFLLAVAGRPSVSLRWRFSCSLGPPKTGKARDLVRSFFCTADQWARRTRNS